MVQRRVALLLDPPEDVGAWMEAVRADGTPPAHLADPTPEALELWKSATRTLDGARVWSERARVIPVKPDAQPLLEPGTLFVRPSSSVAGAKYVQPPKAATNCVEFEFGTEFTASDGTRLPATAAMRCWYDGTRWRPYDLIVYFDHQAMGKTLQFPAF